jgi:hypothetical protein
VFDPGFPDIFANFFFLQIELIKDDFPTFERPIKAYSGINSFGQFFIFGLLEMNSDLNTSI